MLAASSLPRGLPPKVLQHRLLQALVTVVAASPWLLAWSLPPSSTMLNQLLALGAWGLVLVWLGLETTRFRGLSQSLAEVLLGSVLLASLISALVAVLQVLAPELSRELSGSFIAASTLPGRAVGNVRQPNHLASLLIWGAVALVALAALRSRVTDAATSQPETMAQAQTQAHAFELFLWPAMALLMLGVVLSGSRTGLLSVIILAAWGWVDRRLATRQRRVLMSTPLLCAAAWLLMTLWSQLTGLPFGASDHLQLTGQADLSSSRFAIWRNTLSLIAAHPWTGVGWGEFNFAWSLTPMDHRPPALFDHTHNIVLQLLVELGLPLGGLLVVALAALVRATVLRAWRTQGEQAALQRGALMMVLLIGLHSLLEYPLWYLYFLLPAAAALLLAWGPAAQPTLEPHEAPPSSAQRTSQTIPTACTLAGAALLTASLLALIDYQRVSVIYAPARTAEPLSQRMHRGQNALWFGPLADYAVATMSTAKADEPWPPALELAFARSTHVLLDTRLMMAWAKALAARNGSGDLDRARHIADRLREFNNPQSRQWLRECETDPTPERMPFQCERPSIRLDWRDFLQTTKGLHGPS